MYPPAWLVVARSRTRRSIWVPGNQEKEKTLVQKSTRKGWALAGIVSLFAALLGASPAQAAGEGLSLAVTPANSSAVAYTTLVGQPFSVTPTMTNPGDYQYLKYEITNVSGATVSYTVSGTATATASGVTSKSFVVGAAASSTQASKFTLKLDGTTTVSGPVTVSVRAFFESTIDGKYTAGEPNSEQIITFVPYASAGASVVVSAPAEGDTSVKATAAFTGFNTDQLAVTPTIQFKENGANTGSAIAINASNVSTVSTAVAAADTFSAVLSIAGVEVATAATAATTKRTIDTVTVSAVAGDNVKNGTAGQAEARANSAFTVQVKTATSSSKTVVAAIAGTFKVTTTATLSSTVTLKIGDTVYTSKASLPTAAAFTTDANGLATLAVLPTGFSTSDTITVEYTAQNYTNQIVVSQAVPSYTIANVDGDYAYAAKGGSVLLKYTVKDQWKVLSSAKHRLVLTDNGADFTLSNAYPELTAGAASATLAAKFATSAATVTVSATLQKWDTESQNWVSATATADDDVKVLFTETPLNFGTKPASSSMSVSGLATISGSVNLEGGSVSIAGAGLTFTDAEGNTASGTISVRTAANGLFTVSATTKVAGKYNVTVTAGTYSQAIVITVDAVTADSGTKLTIATQDGKTTALPGTTVRLTFTLKDDNGNPVQIKSGNTASLAVTVTGPGFWGTLPTTTDANGQATLNVLLASADTGTLGVTATYTPTDSTKAVTTKLDVVIAEPAAPEVNAVIGSFNGRWAVRVENAKGSAVVYKVGGRWFKATASSDNFVFSRKSRVGASVLVKVWVNGDLQNEQTITVK